MNLCGTPVRCIIAHLLLLLACEQNSVFYYTILYYKMGKVAISNLIASKSERISLLPGEGTSDVWPHFVRAVVDGVLSYHVMCNDCKAVLKWKAKDGTSGLKAHVQSCKGNKHGAGPSRKLTDCPGVSTLPTVKRVTAADKKDVTTAVVHFCARDIRPFSIVEGRY